MGRRSSSPPSDHLVAGFMLPSVVGACPPHYAVRTGSASQSRGAWFSLRARPLPDYRLHRPRVPATGPRWSRTFGPALQLPPSQPITAAATSVPKRKLVPSTHIRCRMVASLRASATLARFMPRRPATSSAQRFRLENRLALVNITWPPSKRPFPTIASPALLIPPVTSVSPDWYF